MIGVILRCDSVRLDEHGCQWRGARTSPVTASQHFSEDFFLASFLDSRGCECVLLWSWEEGSAIDRSGQYVCRASWAVHRAERSRSRERRRGWVVAMKLRVQRLQIVDVLLKKNRWLLVLSTRRCGRCKHCLRNVLRHLRMVMHWRRAGRQRPRLVHLLLVRHHVFRARGHNGHGQTVRMGCKVAVLPVLRARIGIVVEKRRLTHWWGIVRGVVHCIERQGCGLSFSLGLRDKAEEHMALTF